MARCISASATAPIAARSSACSGLRGSLRRSRLSSTIPWSVTTEKFWFDKAVIDYAPKALAMARAKRDFETGAPMKLGGVIFFLTVLVGAVGLRSMADAQTRQ